ncbi:MAG TPA: histidine phosphatase family protein, partial [Ktedonobacterales bacterium]|nr:histidine phosphatase family protein [Ktedonobacterales bacterium]
MHDTHTQPVTPDPSVNGANGATAPASASEPQPSQQQGQGAAQPQAPQKPPRLLILVRHGQTTYNVENRLPGQLPGVALTDEGRRQALRAAVALSGLPLSAVVASPLERAKDTAEIIARGWNLPVRTDPRLMDTDIGSWAGQQIAELKKSDPGWEQYVAHPNEPPEGVESFEQVQRRAVAAVRDLLADESLGSYIVVVSHADVVKLILAHYSGMDSACARFVSIANASISALAFGDTPQPHVLAVNWTALPAWLSPPPAQPQAQPTQPTQATQAEQPASRQPQPAPDEVAEAQTPGGQHEEPVT